MQKPKHFTTQKSFHSQSLCRRQPSPPPAAPHGQFTAAREKTAFPTEAAHSAKGVLSRQCFPRPRAKAHHRQISASVRRAGNWMLLIEGDRAVTRTFANAVSPPCAHAKADLHLPVSLGPSASRPVPHPLGWETGAACPGGATVPQNRDKQTWTTRLGGTMTQGPQNWGLGRNATFPR